MRALEILVVDDDRDVLASLATALTDEGYRARQAEDGLVALEEVRRARPDLVVADIMVPPLDGFGLAQRLLAQPNPVPVVLIGAAPTVAQEAGRLVLPKPLDVDHLLAVVARTLDRPGTSATTPNDCRPEG